MSRAATREEAIRTGGGDLPLVKVDILRYDGDGKLCGACALGRAYLGFGHPVPQAISWEWSKGYRLRHPHEYYQAVERDLMGIYGLTIDQAAGVVGAIYVANDAAMRRGESRDEVLEAAIAAATTALAAVKKEGA